MAHWQFWVDRGGTFTDIVAKDPQGQLRTHKLLSENPRQYKDAAIAGIRYLLGLDESESIPVGLIDAVKMGTTVATNALLERQGEPVLLLTTQGLADVLEIGYQTRPDIFALKIEKPEQLYSQVVEVSERILADGQVEKSLDIEDLKPRLEKAYADGLRSVAIVLMHAYRYPQHELAVAELVRQIGFTQISVSHRVSPLMKIVGRGDTTTVDAYLSPILRRYVEQVEAELGDTRLLFMQSNGGLTEAHHFQGKDAILSGPAGGVVGMVATCGEEHISNIIGFDMGGTSTDVSHYCGDYERVFETQVAGVRVRAPMMQIHTVAAGGGSVLKFSNGRFQVGPDSAGANPGPACYRNGGPLTVTDCNLMLGKINPEFFPNVFGAKADQPLDREAVVKQFTRLADEIKQQTGRVMTPEAVAEGFLDIAVENMANAIKQVSVQRGYDVQDYALCSFGGAGAQHACLVADKLGIKQVFLHPYAGVLSAFGMGLADQRWIQQAAVEAELTDEQLQICADQLQQLSAEGIQSLKEQGADVKSAQVIHQAHVKYQGTDTSLLLDVSDLTSMQDDFIAQHQQQFGFVSEKKLVIEALQVEVLSPGDRLVNVANGKFTDIPVVQQQMCIDGQWQHVLVYQRSALNTEQVITGPCVVLEANSTIVIEAGWQGQLSALGNLRLNRVIPLKQAMALGTEVDPVKLEVFNNLFMSVAEQMGSLLEKTATSVNIKERLDFSCALFNADGDLIANAPHIPVHLGSMSESIKTVIRDNQDMKSGDAYVLNTPYNGGTHLPDITLVKPVFDQNNNLLFFVAARGHHADVGGITPGSMPPSSKHIEEEGILLDNLKLVDQGCFNEVMITKVLADGSYPSRNIEQNIADLKAQLAACEKGAQELNKMVEHFGLEVVKAYMLHVQDNAEACVRGVIDELDEGQFIYPMDDGCQIQVDIQLDKQNRSAVIDFTGTSAQHPGNFNAPLSVARAAVLYVFRCLVQSKIPLNAGIFKALDIKVPEGSMLNPVYPAAVVSGNVETAQVIVDALFGALGVLAASQGTNNNLTFGNDEYQYYETICGGCGAGPGFDGASGVHSHMTNSRLTDPEVLEWRFPVVLDYFGIRKDSGGLGEYNGGNGVERQLRFRQPMTAAIISGHRKVAPFGLAGGSTGAVGRNQVIRADGNRQDLKSCDQAELLQDDSILIVTPGGGGFGAVSSAVADLAQ